MNAFSRGCVRDAGIALMEAMRQLRNGLEAPGLSDDQNDDLNDALEELERAYGKLMRSL